MRCNNLALAAAAAILELTAFVATAQAETQPLVQPAQAATRRVSAQDAAAQEAAPASNRISPKLKAPIDRTGKKRVGKASFYAHMFAGRKMADGKIMDPQHNNAASRTLPLGTTAKVTNLETGKSAVVTIQDRGPYVTGRIVDLSPATARAIGISTRQGVAKVRVSPITVPQPNGETIYGAAIEEARLASDDPARRQFPPVGW